MESFLEIALKQMLLLAAFLGVYQFWLLPRRQFVYNRFFLGFGLLSSLVLPFVSVEKIEVIPFRPPASALSMDVLALEPPQSEFSWEFYGSLLIGAMSVVMALWLLWRLYKVLQILKQSEVVHSKRPKLLLSSMAKAPFSFFQSIVFPKKMYLGPHYEVVLAHEKVHLKQWHSIDVLAIQLVLVFAWWNPLLWIYKKKMLENLEFLADEGTVSQTQQLKNYQYILLNQSVPLEQLSLVQPFYESFLKKRIMMLNNTQAKKSPWGSALLVPLLVAFVFAFNTKTVAQMAPPPPPIITTIVDTIPPPPPPVLGKANAKKSEKRSYSVPPPPPPVAGKRAYSVPPPPPPAKQRNIKFSKTTLSVLIEPSTSDEELKKGYLKVFDVYGVSLDFKKVKRNAQGLITGIKSSFKTNNGKSGNYAVSGTDPLTPFEFYIQMNEQNLILKAGFRSTSGKVKKDRLVVRAGNLDKDSVIVSLMTDLDEDEVVDSKEKIEKLVERAQRMKRKAMEIKVMGKEVAEKAEKADMKAEKAAEKASNKVMKMTIDKLSFTDKDANEFVFFGPDSLLLGHQKKAAVFINGSSFSGDTIQIEYEDIKDIDFDLVLPDSTASSLGGIKARKNGIFIIKSLQDTDASEKKITIKNKGSWNSNSKTPLIVIDGKEQPKDKQINDIDPDHIESVSVLKGKSALKKYGDKGAHGVVEIILKKKE